MVVSPEFLVTSLVVVLVPGTGVIYTVSNGIFKGWREAVAAAVGCTFGIVPHLLASALGVAALLHMSAVAFHVLKLAGAAYLLYLAWGMWRETGSIALEQQAGRARLGMVSLRGFLINILNPKLSIFFLAFLPQFIVPEGGTALEQMLLLGGVFMAMTLFFFIAYGGFAHAVSSNLLRRPGSIRLMRRSFGALFALLGLRLALSEA